MHLTLIRETRKNSQASSASSWKEDSTVGEDVNLCS